MGVRFVVGKEVLIQGLGYGKQHQGTQKSSVSCAEDLHGLHNYQILHCEVQVG